MGRSSCCEQGWDGVSGKYDEAVLLASGMGKRLKVASVPKAFYAIRGHPMLIYPLTTLMSGGVRKFIIIVPQGYAEECRAIVGDLCDDFVVIENDKVERGNAYSLYLSEEHTSDRFFVSCADTFYPTNVLSTLAAYGENGDIIVAGSKCWDCVDPSESCKIQSDNNRVLRIDKNLKEYDFIDMGVFIMGRSVYDVARRLKWKREVHLYQLIQRCVDYGLDVRVADCGGERWMEVDTMEDINKLLSTDLVQRILEGNYEKH